MMNRIIGYIFAFALSVTPALSQSITPQIGGGISLGFDGGISGKKTTGAPLWTPAASAVTAAWWNAQDTSKLTFSALSVLSWTDEITGIVLVGANNPQYSATARNGTAGISFIGSNQSIAFNTNALPQGTSALAIAVAAFNASTTNGYAVDYGGNVTNGHYGINNAVTSNLVQLYTGNASNQYAAAEAWSADRFVVLSINSGAASGNWNVDGLAAETVTPTASVSIAGSPLFVIGNFINLTAAGWNGVIQQVIVFNAVPSTNLRQCTEGWESWIDGKAGANLPGGHPYKSAAPTTANNCT